MKKSASKTKLPPEGLLAATMEATGILEVLRANADAGTVKIIYRVREKQVWLAILEYVLSRANGWTAHVCQQYFMRGGRLVYGWNFILQTGSELDKVVSEVAGLITQGLKAVPKVISTAGLSSFPLVGASHRRTANIVFDPRLPGPSKGGPSHKGAYSIREEG